MCLGLESSLGKFERLMNLLTNDLVSIVADLNEMIIMGTTEEKHWKDLENLIKELCEYSLCIELPDYVF